MIAVSFFIGLFIGAGLFDFFVSRPSLRLISQELREVMRNYVEKVNESERLKETIRTIAERKEANG